MPFIDLRPLKKLFTANNAFNNMIESGHEFRAVELESTAKMLGSVENSKF